MERVVLSAALFIFTLTIAACTSTRAVDAPSETVAEQERPDVENDRPPSARRSSNGMRPYDQVITSEAMSDSGLFVVHRIAESLYFEIPDSLLGREMLTVTRIARTSNIGYGGQQAGNHVFRWEKNGDTVLLRTVSHQNVASEEHPMYEAVRNANFEPIIASFRIEALNADSTAYVVDVTPLYVTDVPVLGLQQSRRQQFQVRRLDGSRTFITSARSFPMNVEVRNVLTYEAGNPPSNSSTGTISLEMNHSMILLPEEPMRPRLHDERVGFFSVLQNDYSIDEEQRVARRRYVSRWRLEPSDWEAWERGEVVEPVKPIVFYVDPATPEKWRPYIRQGVDDWQEAFEAAGFKNAIIGKDPPSPEDDPDFSPEDVRYSIIRYYPSTIQNAYGPRVYDPRSGEIISSHVGWYHNVMNLLRNWYFVQTAAVNPAARGHRFDDEVMGELIRFVSAHEVGHTLGLPHNWGAAAAYTVEQLRAPGFVCEHGTSASIMDYARFNYVAQPGDDACLVPRIGPYDRYAIMWGYRPIPEVRTADEERPVLNEWITERAGDPRFFYGRQRGNPVDPRSQREALGSDQMEASLFGIENLKRIVPNLVSWTARPGEGFDDVQELYGGVVSQWILYMTHVATNVGGVYENHRTYDQEGAVYEFVDRDRQRRAVEFLNEHAFRTPAWLLDEHVLTRVEEAGAVDRIRRLQSGVLGQVLQIGRLGRMLEAQARNGGEAYAVAELFEDLRSGIFSELQSGIVEDPYRRNLQRAYVERLESLVTDDAATISQSDLRPLVRGELQTLRQEMHRARGRTTDRMSRLHYEDMIARIEAALDPRV